MTSTQSAQDDDASAAVDSPPAAGAVAGAPRPAARLQPLTSEVAAAQARLRKAQAKLAASEELLEREQQELERKGKRRVDPHRALIG